MEDSRNDIDLARRALASAGLDIELIVAEDGEEALEYLFATGRYSDRDATELPAVVLLDLKLPKVPGLEVLRRARRDFRTRRAPIVILSSSREERDVNAAYDSGANSYIVKPVDFKEFQRAIEQLGLYWLSLSERPPRAATSSV